MTDKKDDNMGRPVKNWIKPIAASPEDIAKAIFKDADKNIKRDGLKDKGKDK
jgi:hypothetical protein